MSNGIKDAVKQPTLLASIAGYINPVTIIPILAVGAVALVYGSHAKSKMAKKENKRLRTANEALQSEIELYDEPLETVETTVESMSDEELKKEMTRQVMSELGKRSAKKRSKK